MDLFASEPDPDDAPDPRAPLAARMRPRTPEEFVGQEHFFGPGKLLRRMLDADRLASLIFYGPPGTGKTALAHVIARTTQARVASLNAAAAKVADLRQVLAQARERRHRADARTVLFVDEVHRFNKAQQDVLLPDVEEGIILLIGATTHNPFFSVTSALVSRSQIFEFRALSRDHIITLLRRALGDAERGLGTRNATLDDEVFGFIAEVSDGDARRALNALELSVLTTEPGTDGSVHVSLAAAEDCIQRKAILYDHDEDGHYDTASAFIKSLRGSDPDAALYWMAKMLEAGEDPRFVARRIVICAAEDVGNANPHALILANAAFQISEFVGMPEAKLALAQAVTYIACCPKSNASAKGIWAAEKDVREGRTLEVPEHLRDAHYPGSKRLGHGEGYQYAHDFEGHFVEQDYFPSDIVYYEPSDQGHEKQIKERLDAWRKRKRDRQSKNESSG